MWGDYARASGPDPINIQVLATIAYGGISIATDPPPFNAMRELLGGRVEEKS